MLVFSGHIHDDVIKWKHFPRYWPFVRGIHRSLVNSPHKGQWRGALMFSLICVWINGWVNNREAGDLRRYRAHYDVIVMFTIISLASQIKNFLGDNVSIQFLFHSKLCQNNCYENWKASRVAPADISLPEFTKHSWFLNCNLYSQPPCWQVIRRSVTFYHIGSWHSGRLPEENWYSLTHWPLVDFQANFNYWWLRYVRVLWNYPQVIVTGLDWSISQHCIR